MSGVMETAQALGVSRSAVRKAIARGTLRAERRDDGSYAVEPAEIERYRAEHSWPEPETRDAYAAAVEDLARPGVRLDDLDPGVVARARAYATRRHLRWPPR